MKKFECFIDYNNDIEKMQSILNAAKKCGFVYASDFNAEIPTAKELLIQFKKYNHGNAKMILHFFHNQITGRKEISTGSRAVFKTYLQYKNIKIIKI